MPATGNRARYIAVVGQRLRCAQRSASAKHWLLAVGLMDRRRHSLLSSFIAGVAIASPPGRLVSLRTDARVFVRYVDFSVLLVVTTLLAEAL